MSETTYARVAEYRGVQPDALDAALAELTTEVEADLADPPAGLEGLREVLVLVDRSAGRVFAVTLFADEAGMRRADDVLDRRASSQAGGVRTDAAAFEVALRRSVPRE